MVDLADRRAETSSIRGDTHFEPAGLKRAEVGDGRRREADAAPDHLTIAVLDHHADAVRRCRLGADWCRGARACSARSRTDANPEQGQGEGKTQQRSDHAVLTLDPCDAHRSRCR
jgi:hypothetical protein